MSVLFALRIPSTVDCSIVYTKRCELSFHHFPVDPDRRR